MAIVLSLVKIKQKPKATLDLIGLLSTKERIWEKKKSSQEPNKPVQKAKGFKRVPTCYKCGKKGHYNNKCITKAKINAITDEGLKSQLLATFINVSDSDYEDNYSEKTYSKSKALRWRILLKWG